MALLCGVALMAQGCNSAGWKTENYRDEASGAQTVIAKQRFKRDKFEISVAAKCTLPGKLTLEITASDEFRIANAGGAQVIPYSLGINGQAPVPINGPTTGADMLVVPRVAGHDDKGQPLDLALAQRILLQLQFAGGATSIDFSPAEAGVADAFKACGFDPATLALRSAQSPGDRGTLHKPASPLNGQPAIRNVTLKAISAEWECSGDLGDFTFNIDDYRYMFSENAPWSSISGRVSIGAYQAGVDGSATFPLTFEESPWDGEDTPWSYSPLGPGGTIYFISTRTGQSAQCTRA